MAALPGHCWGSRLSSNSVSPVVVAYSDNLAGRAGGAGVGLSIPAVSTAVPMAVSLGAFCQALMALAPGRCQPPCRRPMANHKRFLRRLAQVQVIFRSDDGGTEIGRLPTQLI